MTTQQQIRDLLVNILVNSKAQTKLLQEIYKQMLNPWTGKNQLVDKTEKPNNL